MVLHFDWLKSCHLPATSEEEHQLSGIPLDEDGIPSPTFQPGTTLDMIQDELEDTAGGATQQHHSLTNSRGTSPYYAQNAKYFSTHAAVL